MDGLLAKRARLEQRLGWQVACRAEHFVRACAHAALLAKHLLNKVWHLKRIVLDQAIHDVEMPWVLEEHLGLDSAFAHDLGCAQRVIKGSDQRAGARAAIAAAKVIGLGFSASTSGLALVGADL